LLAGISESQWPIAGGVAGGMDGSLESAPVVIRKRGRPDSFTLEPTTESHPATAAPVGEDVGFRVRLSAPYEWNLMDK
jgi:hypothetical protein